MWKLLQELMFIGEGELRGCCRKSGAKWWRHRRYPHKGRAGFGVMDYDAEPQGLWRRNRTGCSN